MNILGLDFVAEDSPDRKRGFMGSWLDFGSIAGLCWCRRSGVNLDHCRRSELPRLGWRIPFFIALPLGIIGFTCAMRWKKLRRSSSMSINLNRATV
ncbi:MFS transporter [Escherichia coli]